MDCIHCGLCLSQCPTYAENGNEADSPRGRIYLMRALAEGRAEPTPDLVSHLDSCLGCRGCETACPSGVQYGHLLEGARGFLRENYNRPARQKGLHAAIENSFPYPNRLDAALFPVRVLRRFGVLPLLNKIGFMRLLGPLGDMEGILPPLPPIHKRLRFPRHWKARGNKTARVGMVEGCVMPVMLTNINTSTARVLAKAGCEVEVPKKQGCCGALHAHIGDLDGAREFAKRNIEGFEELEATSKLDAIIINAAGCGASLKEYGHWFADDKEWAERAKSFSAKVKDVSEWLAQPQFQSRLEALMKGSTVEFDRTQSVPKMHDIARETLPNTGGATTLDEGANSASQQNRLEALDADEATLPNVETSKLKSQTTTYHDACHLAHGQGIRAEPRQLMDAVPGVEMVPLVEAELCCGSAGIYNITQPKMAMQLLERKMKHIADTGAKVVVTGNPGCLMQIMLGAKKFGVDVEVKHPVEVLDSATGK